MPVICEGRNVSTNEVIRLEADAAILHVDPVLAQTAPAADALVSSGFVDLQVNGFAGADFNSPATTLDAIQASMNALFATGVTRFFPTVITAAPESMLAALANLARAKEKLARGEAMEGFHVEGPHISAEDGPRGAHPAPWVRPPDFEEFQRWQEASNGQVRIVTIAPEWPEALRYIERVTREGIVVSIGHSAATPEQVHDAIRAGATLSTHLGNAAPAMLPRHRNLLLEQLADDRLTAGFIVDDFHLADSFLRVALRSKGIERSVLVSDAVGPTLGEIELDRMGDRVVLKGGSRLAGSGLRMDRAIANVVRRGGVSLNQAVTMATINPARAGRVRGRLRGLQAGERGDVVRFRWEDGQLSVMETYLSGERVFGGTQACSQPGI